jgi:hypothetical protein
VTWAELSLADCDKEQFRVKQSLFVIIATVVILREERFLERNLHEEYSEYKADCPTLVAGRPAKRDEGYTLRHPIGFRSDGHSDQRGPRAMVAGAGRETFGQPQRRLLQ